jgi:hypothetical protein
MHYLKWLIYLVLLCVHGFAHANANPKLLIYIQPQEYEHPVKLWQYFREYWVNQGEFAELAAKEVLGASYGEVEMCDASQQAGQVLVWLRPRIFYNPQLQVFHLKITAMAYTADGKPLETFVAETSKFGYLDVKPEVQVKQIYDQSMQIIADKMLADDKMQKAMQSPQALLNEQQDAQVQAQKNPCAMVSLFPTSKIQFMSF